jgi:hypothetical protein
MSYETEEALMVKGIMRDARRWPIHGDHYTQKDIDEWRKRKKEMEEEKKQNETKTSRI